MSSVIERIAEIEMTAEGVVNHAEEHKKEIEEIYQAAREEFDESMVAKTKEKLARIREEADRKMEAMMEDETLRGRRVIEELEREYEEHHEAYAQEILGRIIAG